MPDAKEPINSNQNQPIAGNTPAPSAPPASAPQPTAVPAAVTTEAAPEKPKERVPFFLLGYFSNIVIISTVGGIVNGVVTSVAGYQAAMYSLYFPLVLSVLSLILGVYWAWRYKNNPLKRKNYYFGWGIVWFFISTVGAYLLLFGACMLMFTGLN